MLFHAMHSIVFQNNMQTEYILNTNRKDYKTINKLSLYSECYKLHKAFHTHVCVCVCVCVCIYTYYTRIRLTTN